jgi:caffeoyl-CoA O-methyltransferase
MLSLLPEAITQYVEDHAPAESALHAELRAETQAKLAFPQMQVGRVEGAFLRLVAAISGARTVLEIGTFSGYSGLCLAEGLREDGRVITCDVDPVATEVARRYFARSPYGHKIELRLGPALETIAQLTKELARDKVAIDLVFIDADKENATAYWEAVMPLLPPGGVIMADNTLWSGKVLDPREPSDHAIARFNDHVAADPRVDHVLLSVRDGIVLARKR